MNKPRTTVGTIVRIMKMVVKHMESGKPKTPAGGVPLLKRLLARGFSPEDVNSALRWLTLLGIEHSEIPVAPSPFRPGSMRHLHQSESIRLAPDSQMYLLSLLESGRLSSGDFEQLIQYLWQNDLREVSPSRLNLILEINHSLAPEPGKIPLGISSRLPPPSFVN